MLPLAQEFVKRPAFVRVDNASAFSFIRWWRFFLIRVGVL
jgi:hypothetical protein